MARRTGRAPAKATNNFKGQANARRPRDAADAGPSKPRTIHDVYDYAVDQEDAKRRGRQGRAAKRAQTATDQPDEDDDRRPRRRPAGSDEELDSDDDEDARRGGVIGTDEELGSDDEDSDIESDEAFGEGDDEEYGGYAFASERKGKRGQQEEEEEDDDEEGMVDLSTMLDGGAFAGSDDDDDDEGSDEDERSDDEGDFSNLAQSYAQPTKRAVDDDDDGAAEAPSKRRRRVLSERTEAGPESEYAAPSTSARGTLGLDDLLAPLSNSTKGEHTALLNSTKALRAARGDKQPVASKRGGGALTAPLPDVVKDRLQRSAGYEVSRQEAEKWQPTIKRLREAEHLSFPLQPDTSRPKASTAQLAATFKPSNALEQDIDALLQSEGMSEQQIAKSEELAMRHLSPQQQQRRREELRKMRELMFRQEQKAKRVSKIKSKTFRKIARKDKERQQAKLREAGLLDDGEGSDAAEDDEERLKHERDRAKERATLKHKNTGKWAKAQLGKRGDDSSRDALNEQLQKAQQLRRRMEGRGDESGEDSDEDSDAGQSDADPARAAFDELDALDAKEQRANAASGASGKKGVWNMKFMQDARNREDAATQQMRDDLETDLRKMGGGSDGEHDEADDLAEQPVGRRVFKAAATTAPGIAERPAATKQAGPAAESSSSSPEPAPAAISQSRSQRKLSPVPAQATNEDADASASNPWLVQDPAKRHQQKAAVASTSTAAAKSASKLEKRKLKADSARREADDDGRLDIDPEAMLSVKADKVAAGKSNKSKPAAKVQHPEDGSNDEDEDAEPVELSAAGRRAPRTAFTQRDLIAEAFAGDDVAADFAAQKARIEADDAPQEVDNSALPGWGSWGGKGVKTNRKSGAQRAKKAAVMTPGLETEKRKDAGMSNVIINERKDKKAAKYQVKDL